jgi:hypothetical protein
MSSDGAHLGVSADRALKTILGGEPSPGEDEQMSVTEFRDWILQPDQEPYDYGEAARRCARMILEFYLADPKRASVPVEGVYDWTDYNGEGVPPLVEKGLYDVMKEAGHAEALERLGLTGFQWGWAVNAARRCVELPPEPNPAIVTIRR